MGIVASVILSVNRINIESKDKTIDIILDLDEIENLSKQSDQDLSWWLRKFKDWGASSAALPEESFDSLLGGIEPIEAQMLGNLMKNMGWERRYSEEFVNYLKEGDTSEYDLVISTNSSSLYSFIEEGLRTRYKSEKYEIFKSYEEYIFVIDGTVKEALYTTGETLLDSNNKPYKQNKYLESSKLVKLGLGYDQEKIDLIKDSGLEVVLRPSNFNPHWEEEEKYIEATLKSYEKYNIKPEYMIFSGENALGYPEHSNLVLDFMKDNDTKLALIESGVQRGHIKQAGTEEFASILGYNSVRLFSMAPYIQQRYKHYNYGGAEEIENTLYRAVTERNIRLIYFRPFKHDSYTYVTDEFEYEKTFNSFENRIAKHGMKLGSSSTMKLNVVSRILTILIGLGVLGGGMILISFIFNLTIKFKRILLILGIIFVPAITYVAPYTSKAIFAILAAIVYPSLSMAYCCTKLKDYFTGSREKNLLKTSILEGIKILITISAISLIGAIFVASLLSSTDYLLEIKVFRGVKIVQIIPILLYAIMFIGVFGYKTNKTNLQNKFTILDLKELIFDNIKIITVTAGILIAGIGYIYLARTGHETDIQPSDYEMIVRNFLEMKLLARPRTKEFLMAFPAVLIAVYMALKKNKVGVFILGLLIIIGQTSIINTFSHLRTPMYLSIIRNIYGLGFGIIMGILYVVLLQGAISLFKVLEGEIFNE